MATLERLIVGRWMALAAGGWRPEQIARLLRLTVRIWEGEVHESTPEYRRLVFARRLYDAGCLSEFGVESASDAP